MAVKGPWELDGRIVVDAEGRVIECDRCPCESSSSSSSSSSPSTSESYTPWPEVPTCEDCDEKVLGFTMDLTVGVGTLGNGTCSNCANIAGSYKLEYACRCAWIFYLFEFCQALPFNSIATLSISAFPQKIGGVWHIAVSITLTQFYNEDRQYLEDAWEDRDSSRLCGGVYEVTDVWQRLFRSNVTHVDCEEFAGETLTEFTLVGSVNGSGMCTGSPTIDRLVIQ